MTCNILGEAEKVESGARGWNSVLKMIGCHRHDSQWGHCRCWTYVGHLGMHACSSLLCTMILWITLDALNAQNYL